MIVWDVLGLLAIWLSAFGAGWLWRHYSPRYHLEAYRHGYTQGRHDEIYRRGARYTDGS